MAKVFKPGDFRSGYYRDQTFMMAIGALTLQQYFAGLYGHTDIKHDPMSAGRQMGGHFATPFIDENGKFLDLVNRKNSSADISPTAGQMPRLLGLAYASHFFRVNPELQTPEFAHLSNKLAPFKTGIYFFDQLEKSLKNERKYEINRTHFGSDKDMLLYLFGHPGNARYREF